MTMECRSCEENYLHKIYRQCVSKHSNINDALENFDMICMRSGDPRSPLTIAKAISSNNCEECKHFKRYYENLIRE